MTTWQSGSYLAGREEQPVWKETAVWSPLLSKCMVIQIFIWTQDVDRSIEQNKSSLWCSCQNWLKQEPVYRRPEIFQQFFLQTSTLRLITLPIWVNGKPYSHLSPLVPHYFSIYDDWGQGCGTKEEVIKHECGNFCLYKCGSHSINKAKTFQTWIALALKPLDANNSYSKCVSSFVSVKQIQATNCTFQIYGLQAQLWYHRQQDLGCSHMRSQVIEDSERPGTLHFPSASLFTKGELFGKERNLRLLLIPA